MTTSPFSSPAEPARARRRALITAVLTRRHEQGLARRAAAAAPAAPVPGLPAARDADAPAVDPSPAPTVGAPAVGATTLPGPPASTPSGSAAATPIAAPVRVFLVLGSLGPTAGLGAALAATGRFVVVGASSDPVLGVDLAAEAQPDVVLVDRFLGLADGLAVARHLHRDAPRAAIVLRTPWPEPDRHDAARAGAATTVDVAAGTDELAAALLAAGARPGVAA
ncbi:response regulator transcription factor [Patulibacter sp. SYSU D01012]|uniref:response regulator transcription factor n=1 Tax=Patulibacter sp. SYSU D01012 TaxID=2817381 RepID=UPI001B311613|nr:response regulator transcription factor [Patulibacter sp. SYSU D01012]